MSDARKLNAEDRDKIVDLLKTKQIENVRFAIGLLRETADTADVVALFTNRSLAGQFDTFEDDACVSELKTFLADWAEQQSVAFRTSDDWLAVQITLQITWNEQSDATDSHIASLTELSESTAALIALYPGSLNLRQIQSITPEAALQLSRSHCDCEEIDLSGLQDLDLKTASFLAHCSAGLLLDGLQELTDELAAILSHHKGPFLSLDGLRHLSATAARILSHYTGTLYLQNLDHADALDAELARLIFCRPSDDHSEDLYCKTFVPGWSDSSDDDSHGTADEQTDLEPKISTYLSGKKKREERWNKDYKRNGLQCYWYENGNKSTEENYHHGILVSAASWKPDGTPCPETKLIDGSGTYASWHENGQKKSQEHWENAKLVSAASWKPDGTPCPETKLVDGSGIRVGWHVNDQREFEEHWQDGKQHGPMTYWYENGQKEQEGHWKNNEQDGLWHLWYSNGQKQQEGHWKSGNLVYLYKTPENLVELQKQTKPEVESNSKLSFSLPAAEVLVDELRTIDLPITSLTAEIATAFARHQGSLILDQLTELDRSTADALAGHTGSLSLNGLTHLTDETASALANYQGECLSLTGLNELSDAAASSLSEFPERLCLQNELTIANEALRKKLEDQTFWKNIQCDGNEFKPISS